MLWSCYFQKTPGRVSSLIVIPSASLDSQLESVVPSENTSFTDEHITAKFVDRGATEVVDNGKYIVTPTIEEYEFQTERKVSKTGLMMIGIGGNNGSTLSATIRANRHQITWNTKNGLETPNYIGSLLYASTFRLGVDSTTSKDIHVPVSEFLPMVHPNVFVLGGWDISAVPMEKAMTRSKVLDYDLQRQEARADNVIPGQDKQAHLEHIRADIRKFKQDNELERLIVFWTANTERFADIIPGVNDTADNLLKAIKTSHEEVSPSTIFAVAAILEGEPFVNGAPQNTFVPGAIELAEHEKSFIGGDDLKSGQTKLKSVLAEFLVNTGIKPLSIASYNHLGNNNGHNLSAERQFRSKEVSKSSVVDDMVAANRLLFKPPELNDKGTLKDKGEHPDDDVVVIKYVPAVGDSKRAINEYLPETFCSGRSVANIFNECKDSLLATPLILDLSILAELLTRVKYRKVGEPEFKPLHSVLSLLSYMLKAPLVKPGTEVINSLNRQRNALEAFLKACLGLEGSSDLLLETRLW
ncbi:inositol-3-phosphate synthase [Coprinopsis marcescibilis]|uniref:Inositol-3-phosphate synthase n=1 Tax=Coprinopsis marcescibilis TaxID=230819 RepID=A0A5C3KCW1_COPMA|nr:inositol-3-phosphate synthase [Coprinopsis marcescibilis]